MHNTIKHSVNMQVNRMIALLGFLCLAVSFATTPSQFMGKVLSLLLVVSVVSPIIKSIKTSDYHLTILLAFMTSYVLVAFNYFWFGKHIVKYNPCESLETVFKVLQILSMFHFILLYFLNYSRGKEVRRQILKESNPNVFTFLAVVSLLITLLGSSGQNIFESGGYAETINTRESTSFFVYNLIPLSLTFIYADTPQRRKISYLLVAFFCAKDLLFGGRVDTIQLLLILFFIKFQYIWSKKRIILLASAGALFMSVWGILRGHIDFNMIDIYMRLGEMYFDTDSEIDYQIGNSADVYYAAVRIIYLINENVLTIELRIISFICFFLSVFVPFSYLPDVANLASFMQKDYWSGGGGLAPVFFFAFAGYFGVIVFSFLISHLMNLFHKLGSSKYVHYYTILMLATTPRWYAYYPIQIIKFCVLGALFYWILEHNFKKRKKVLH